MAALLRQSNDSRVTTSGSSKIQQRQLHDSLTTATSWSTATWHELRPLPDSSTIAARGVNDKGHWVRMFLRSCHLRHKQTLTPASERVTAVVEIVDWCSEIHLVPAKIWMNKKGVDPSGVTLWKLMTPGLDWRGPLMQSIQWGAGGLPTI
jgi:hypothetical protein